MNKILKRTIWIALTIYGLILLIFPAVMIGLSACKHAYHSQVFCAEDAGLSAADTLSLMTSDGLRIHCLKVMPEGEPKGSIICLSGIENPSVTYFLGHARLFHKLGFVTYLPDLRAHGRSDGRMICLGYKESKDVRAVADCIKRDSPDLPIVVMGLSMGGGVAINSLDEVPEIDVLITSSAFSSIGDFMQYQLGRFITPVLAWPVKYVTETYASMLYGVNAFMKNPLKMIEMLDGRPILMMHSREDSQVPFRCFEKLTEEASKHTDKLETYVVDGDEHFITSNFGAPEKDTAYYSKLENFLVRTVRQ